MGRASHTFLFGYGSQGRFIASTLKSDKVRFTIIESDRYNHQYALDDGFVDIILIDVTSDRALSSLSIEQSSDIICVMSDEHINVFLTLSLRSLYPDNTIYAISNSIDTAQKLKMAGANSIIDLYEVSAKKISNILNKPVATKLLDSFLSNSSDISFKEITIPVGSTLDGRLFNEINYRHYGILLVGILESIDGNFMFVTHHKPKELRVDDVLVCMGKDKDLERFEEKITRGDEIR